MEEAETARAVSTHAFTKKVINKTALPLCLDSNRCLISGKAGVEDPVVHEL